MMVNMRQELKDVRVMQSAVTETISKMATDTVKAVKEKADEISKHVKKKAGKKETFEPSPEFETWRDYTGELRQSAVDEFRRGVDVTTKRYEDAIARLGGKVTILENEAQMLQDAAGSLATTVGETVSAAGGLGFAGMFEKIGLLLAVGVGAVVVIKVLDVMD